MATKPSSGLLKLEEQLTCPVCLDHYTNPKTLPCLHSFCEHCLEGLPLDKKNETYYLSCPTCRHRTEISEEGAGAFPVAFTINNLEEIYSSIKKVADPQQVTCENCTTANATGYCKDCSQFLCTECISTHKKWARFSNHQLTSLDEVTSCIYSNSLVPAKQEATLICSVPGHDEPLKYYCDTCDESICRDCAILTHKDHKYNLIANSFSKHREALEKSLNPVKKKIVALKNVLSALAERESEVKKRGEKVLKEIHEMAEEMMNVLRQSERKLTEQAKRVTDDKLKVLSEQMKSTKISLSLLEDVENYVEQSLKTGSPQQVLRSKKQMMERMSEVTTGINVEELHLKEKADFILRKHIKSLHHIGDIVASTALQKFRVKKINCIEHVGKTVSFSLSIEAPDLSLLSVPLSFLRCSLVPVAKDDQPSHTTVTTTSTDPGVYRVQCNLSTTGTHSYIVKIQIYGVQLEDIIYVDNTSVHIVTYPWVVAFEDWHDGILCHQFAQWKAGDDRVGAEAELIAMTAKNGIECPMCKLHFELAKRDCNNWRMSCIRCPTEFCFGCKRMYFKSGYECDRQYCKTGASRPLPQHAHHPRDCLFYLRDYDVVSLKKLLDDNNVKYLSKPSEAQVAATKDKRVQGEPIDKPDGEEWDIPKPPAHVIDGKEILLVCPVILLKETPSGFGDEPCRKHAPFGMAGLCKWHYKEYLVHKINEAKLDPVEIYNLRIVKLIIKREGIEVPEEYDDEDEEHYKGRLVEIVKEKIPID